MGGQRQHTDGVAQEIVEAWRPEERPMATIVLNHEQPHQECRCRHGQQQRYPVGVAHGEGHRSPERRQGDDGGQKLKHAAPRIGRGVTVKPSRRNTKARWVWESRGPWHCYRGISTESGYLGSSV